MIEIKKSETADTRSCDYTKVSKETLLLSSMSHIEDVKKGMNFIAELMQSQALLHDSDKITEIDSFHNDFVTGFKNTTWWDNHRKINRHHLSEDEGVPENVNLIDVIEMLVDGVMAGKARSGSVYQPQIKTEVLIKAFNNTFEMLKNEVIVEE